MITDFSNLINVGLRHITINGADSLSTYGLLICKESNTENTAAKSVTEDMAYTNGIIDMSLINGKLFYEPRTLTYKFKIAAATPQEYIKKQMQLKTWFDGVGKCSIADSNYLTTENSVSTQWIFTNCVYKGCEADKEKFFGEVVYGYATVVFVCDPYLSKIGEVNERILKCAASGTITLNITNNSSYTITAGSSTSAAVSYTAAEPYKYRLVVYAENPETITLNGSEIAAEEVFTMPSSAEIIVSATGYKYVELWHDTRTGVRL